ncbi:hypothetical protein BJX76DRAFT_339380 [Aspergillus varians]
MDHSLEIIYEPRHGRPVDMNIVFIHGLSGNSRSTWTHEDTSTFWPEDMLPREFPYCRVLTYSYAADLMDFFPKAAARRKSIDDHSTDLIEALNNFRAVPQKAHEGIAFVAHSLGGLICANALTHDKADETNIRRYTSFIFFFATPFADPECLDLWTDTVENFYILCGMGNDDFENPNEQTTMARSVIKRFGEYIHSKPRSSIQLIFFAEDDPIKNGNADGIKILEEDMAAPEGGHSVTIEGDHVSMCKLHYGSSGCRVFFGHLSQIKRPAFSEYMVATVRVRERPGWM